MWRVLGGGSRLCAEHGDVHLEEQREQLLVARPVRAEPAAAASPSRTPQNASRS